MRVKYVFTKKSFDKIVEDHLINRCYLPYNKVIYSFRSIIYARKNEYREAQ